jgi:hypothetical protein
MLREHYLDAHRDAPHAFIVYLAGKSRLMFALEFLRVVTAALTVKHTCHPFHECHTVRLYRLTSIAICHQQTSLTLSEHYLVVQRPSNST